MAPEMVPSWSRTRSVAVEPLASSKPKAATSPSLSTVTVTFAEVRVFPAASRATALSVCSPSVSAVVFQASEYGLDVSAEPTFAPSTRNCTLCTPTASEALAVTVGVPDTVAPALGELIETVGALLSTLTATAAEVRVLPAVSVATARERVVAVGEPAGLAGERVGRARVRGDRGAVDLEGHALHGHVVRRAWP